MSGDEGGAWLARYPWALRVERFADDGMHDDLRAELREHFGHDASPEEIQGLRDHGLPIGWRPPRSEWGPGPWQDEPDLVEWRSVDVPYPLLMVRGRPGAWSGYVGLPPGHPLHGCGMTDAPVVAATIDIITWARASCRPVRATGEPPTHWFLGFDCAHAMQYAPRLECRTPGAIEAYGVHYVTLDECRAMTEDLAESLLGAAKPVLS